MILRTLLLALLAGPAFAGDGPGQVHLPLDTYNQLLAQDPGSPERRATWAYGPAELSLTMDTSGAEPFAVASIRTSIQVFEAGVDVPVLAGAGVRAFTVNGSDARLHPSAAGLVWRAEAPTTTTLTLEYVVDASRSDQGWSLQVPLPPVPSTRLTATLPGTGLDVAAIPAAGPRTTHGADRTSLSATVPAAPGVQVSWRAPSTSGHTLSRARYTGTLQGDAVAWTASFSVDSDGGEAFVLPLLPASVALVSLSVDGKEAAVLVDEGRFATRVRGGGRHDVQVVFEVPVQRGDGPPKIVMDVPMVPVSRFLLTLPGEKEVTVAPAAAVALEQGRGRTLASVNIPMSPQVVFSWSEAIPEDVATEVRSNANVLHAAWAEEGVLYVRAAAVLEVTRGQANQFELDVPPDVQVNQVRGGQGGVADWRVKRASASKPGVLTVFLDREVQGEFVIEVEYERLLSREPDTAVAVPLLAARAMHRQRGMVALLSSKELTLKPVDETAVTRVGENQLPAFFKQAIEMTVAHTFKYAEPTAALTVQATKPERKEGRFDAQVNTLVSLSDVSLRGAATVEINVKSGALPGLRIGLPKGVNFLNLSAPSLRGHELKDEAGAQVIDVEFTQDLEGRFRVEVAYEQILGDAEGELAVPTLSVEGAEVEQGRIAVEALSAVEVSAATTQQLSSVDVSELPQQLVLQTTNPILLAYKYVHVDPPYRLGLKVTRHREIDVQAAAIDAAHYATLFTEDGLAVTTARFSVRNRREQFLRVRLPKGSEIWSATVSGEAEKPALGEDSGGRPEVLIKIRNSEQAFPVQLVYATPVPELRFFGRLKAELPRPDMIATKTELELFLPAELRYGKPKGDMQLQSWGGHVSSDELRESLGGPGTIQVAVPMTGTQMSFSKLYANQGGRDVSVSVPYASRRGRQMASLIAAGGTLLVWLALGLGLTRRRWPADRRLVAVGVVGLVLVALAVGYLDVPIGGPLTLSLLALIGGLVGLAIQRTRRHMNRDVEELLTDDEDGGDDGGDGGDSPAPPAGPEPDDDFDPDVDATPSFDG